MTELRHIAYEADGREMIGTLVIPDGSDWRPGVLVAHEGNGLGDHTRTIASRLAELGYVAFALDYYGGGKFLPDRDAINERLSGLIDDADRTRAIARAGLAVLLAEDRVDTSRIAAIGFCFGGTVVLELARGGEDIKSVVGFHAGLGTRRPEDASNITAKVLVCIGAEDPLVTPAERAAFEAEMRAGGGGRLAHEPVRRCRPQLHEPRRPPRRFRRDRVPRSHGRAVVAGDARSVRRDDRR